MPRITKAQIVQHQKDLKTDAAIGREYGISRQAVHQIRRKFGIDSVLVKNPQRNQDICKSYEKGIAAKNIAKIFNLSISQTYRIINTDIIEKKIAKKLKELKINDKKKIVKKKVNKKTETKVAPKKAITKKSKKLQEKTKRK